MIQWKEKGQGLAEYAFIIVLVVLVVIALVAIVGSSVVNMYQTIIQAV